MAIADLRLSNGVKAEARRDISRNGIAFHERVSDGKDEWLTPQWILRGLGAFDLDPCAPVIRPWNIATAHFSLLDDGLSRDWRGRVFLNPPYSSVRDWMERMAAHGNGIALIFARTETAVWFDFVWPVAAVILFLRGRVRFCHVDGHQARTNAGAPSALIGYGESNADAIRACGIPGHFVAP